jgi:predicted membrane protein
MEMVFAVITPPGMPATKAMLRRHLKTRHVGFIMWHVCCSFLLAIGFAG